jgi:hypothetical protein
MPIFQLTASRSYNPVDNPVNRTVGTVGATSGSTTVSITSADRGAVSAISSAIATRTVTVIGSTLPLGGSVTSASGSTLTLTYPYSVTVSAGASGSWLDWYFKDAPNEKQLPITSVLAASGSTLAYLDFDGTGATLTGVTGQLGISVLRTVAGTTGSVWGYSRGYSN